MKALLIAKLTLRRMLRAHYLIATGILVFTVMILFLSQSREAGGNQVKILEATSMALFFITTVICYLGSIWMGISILPEEISSGNMRMNLTKPASAISVLFGHFLGMFAYLAGTIMACAVVLTAFVALRGGEPGMLIIGYLLHLLPLYACYLSLCNVMALLFNRPIATFFLLFLAHENFMRGWAEKAAESSHSMIVKLPLEIVGYLGYALAPPTARLKVRLVEFMALDFPVQKYLLILAYCVSYILLAHFAASWLLRRKEI